MTTVSIIMPAYNAAPFVAEAVRSVQAQSFCDWELIVVDDGSTDETRTIVEAFPDPRIKVIRQPNGGASVARNAGLDAAVGDYVTFMDADDRLPPNALSQRVAYLDGHPDVDIANGRIRVSRDGATVRPYVPSTVVSPLLPRLARLEEAVFFGVVYMIRRAAIGSHRFPVGIAHCEDLIFFLELAHDRGLTYGAVDVEVYEYCLRPSSAMANLTGIEAGYLALLGRARGLARLTAAQRRHLQMRVASILLKSWLRRGRPLRAARAVLRALADGSAAKSGEAHAPPKTCP